MADNFDIQQITNIAEFWQRIYREKAVKIKFEKKDGTERIMLATLDFSKIPERDRPREVNVPKILNGKIIPKCTLSEIMNVSLTFNREYAAALHKIYKKHMR